jgi:hypothetical protein
MKIFIGFSKPIKGNPFAALIQWVEARPYDHVYIRIQEPMDGEYLIFQASGLQVNLINIIIFKSKHQSLKEYEIDITNEQYQILWRFIKSMLGVPYSLKEDFGILLMKIFKIKQPFNDGIKAEFCSKLGATVCQLMNIPISENPDNIDPSGLDMKLQSLNLICNNFPEF